MAEAAANEAAVKSRRVPRNVPAEKVEKSGAGVEEAKAESAPKESSERSEQAREIARVIRESGKPEGALASKLDSRLVPVIELLKAKGLENAEGLRAFDAEGAQAIHSAYHAILAPSGQPERLAVQIDAKLDEELLKDLKECGLEIVHAAPKWNTVEGSATLSAIERLTRLEKIRFIGLQMGRRTRRSGAVYNQAAGSMKADQARAQYGVTGAGQKIGILSDTVHRVIGGTINAAGNLVGSASQISGDLPPTVRVLDPGPNDGSGTDEGAGMMELAYDVAPGASYAFASAYTSMTAFADNITALRTTAGCTITCDDVFYFAEPMFQDGPVAQAAEGNVAAGVPHFTAAGNEGEEGIAATYVDINPSSDNTKSPNPDGDDFHDWGIGGATPSFLPITLASGADLIAVLQWNQPYASWGLGPGSQVDLDLYVYASAATNSQKLATSRASQGTTGAPAGDPYEILEYQNTGLSSKTVYLALDHFRGNKSGVFFRIVFLTSGTLTYNTSVVNAQTIYGHSAAAGAESVGAIFFGDIDLNGIFSPDFNHVNAEYYTSKGGLGPNGIPYYFDTAGNPLPSAPVRRDKPDIAAPDGANTTFFGYSDVADNPPGFEPDTYPNFFGTSAAAPNAAAVAALIMEKQPGISPAVLKTRLASTAVDIVADNPLSGSGPDAFSGPGLVDAVAALAATGPSAPPIAINAVSIAAPANPNAVPKYGKVELLVTLANVRASNFYNPDPLPASGGLDLSATFSGPSGPQTVKGYYDGTSWRVRFAPRSTGAWTFTVQAIDPSGTANWSGGAFTCVASSSPGFAQIDGRFLRFTEGQAFFAVGHNTGWQYDVEVPTLASMKSRGENLLSFWINAPWTLPAGTTADQVAGTPAILPDDIVANRTPIENAVNGLGNYNQDACAYLDGVVSRAEAAGVYLLPSIYTHGQLRDPNHPWSSGGEHYWYNNPYKSLGAPKNFFSTGAGDAQWIYQKNYYRYLLARWGYSQAIAGWVALVEIDGTTGYGGTSGNTDVTKARTWCAAVRDYFRANDLNRTNALGKHPLTVSKLNAANFYTEISGGLDMACTDSYTSQTSDVGVANTIGGDTLSMRNSGQPALHAEFGGDVPGGATQPTHLHNGIWAGLAAGAAMSPLLWTDGLLSQGQHFPLLTETQGNMGPLMRDHLESLAEFAGGLSYLGQAGTTSSTATLSDAPSTRGWITKLTDRGYGWLQKTTAGTIGGQTVTISGLNPGVYKVEWFDVWTDGLLPFQTTTGLLAGTNGVLSPVVPALARQDLALRFVMTAESLDYGDAPDSYKTLLASNGARHDVSALKLGATIDYETDGFPSAAANGDDTNATADEDGVSGLGVTLYPGATVSITVTASAAGFLDAWVDFNRNGSFADATEQIFTSKPLLAGANAINFTVPVYATPGASYARFRFSSTGALSYSGAAPDGEVEDYAVTIGPAITVSIAAVPVQTAPERDGVTFPLNATVSYAGPGPLTYTWSKLSGNGIVTFSTPNQEDTNATICKALTYQLQLVVTADPDGPGGNAPLSGQASLTVDVEDRLEPNDSSAQAITLEPEGYQNLYLKAGNEDWYRMDAPVSGETLVAKIFYRWQDGLPAQWTTNDSLRIEIFTNTLTAVSGSTTSQSDDEYGENMRIKGTSWVAAAGVPFYYVKISKNPANPQGTANHYSMLLRRGPPTITAAHASSLALERISGTLTTDANYVNNVTQMAFGPDGRLYCTSLNGNVYSFAYSSSGVLSDRKIVATPGTASIYLLGIAFHGSTMYVTRSDTGAAKTASLRRLTDTNADGIYETSVDIVNNVSIGYHHMDHLQIIGNTLYVSIGTRAQDTPPYDETAYNGSICMIQDLTLVPSSANAAGFTSTEIANGLPWTSTAADKLRVHSCGGRNPFGLALDGDGALWMTQNLSGPVVGDGFDNDFTDDHWDELFKTQPKADYGYLANNQRTNPVALGAGFFTSLLPAYVPSNAAAPFQTHDPKNPVGLGPACSPDGFSFYTGNTFPLAYHKRAFITRFGAPWESGLTRDALTGYQAMRYSDVVSMDPATGQVQRVAKGFNSPLDTIMDPFGNVLVADYQRWTGSSTAQHPSDYNEAGIYRIKPVSPVVGAHAIAWNVDGDGNWSERLKWNPAVVPHQWGSARYDVTIDRPSADPAVTLDLDATVNNVNQTDRLVLPAARTLTLTGNFSQTAMGVLQVEIGGPAALRNGRIVCAGAANLAGELDATLAAGYSPVAGDSFEILDFASRSGAFGVVNLPSLPGGLALQAVYESNRLLLNVVQGDTTKPVLVSASWTNGGGIAGVSAGDTITLTFSEPVTLSGSNWSDVIGLPVSGDTLGAANGMDTSALTTTKTFTLAGAPLLTPGGLYSSGALTAGKPSGIFLSNGLNVVDGAGNTALTGSAGTAVDLGPASATLAITWAAGTSGRNEGDTVSAAWNLGATPLNLGQVHRTDTSPPVGDVLDALDYVIRSSGNTAVALTVTCSNGQAWTLGATAGANVFEMGASANNGLSYTSLDPGTSPTGVLLTGVTGTRSGSTQAFDLRFKAPMSTSTGAAQSIAITITASAP